MKKIFLILLFCILSFNIFGQNLSNSLYYITLDLFYEKLHEEEILKRTKFKWQWSDGECTEGILESGFYNKYIVKCIFQFDKYDEKEQELCKEGITHIWENSFICCNISQYKIVTKLISQKYEGNYYCASETLNFKIESLNQHLFNGLLSVTFLQDENKHFYGNFKSNEFNITYTQLCNILNPTYSFYVEVKFKDFNDIERTITDQIYPILPQVKIDESKLAVVDDKFYYPELLGSQKITFKNIKMALNYNFNSNYTEPYNLEKYYGWYNVIIEENNKCPLTKSFIYPELQYNYVNNSEEYNFWYEGEEGNPVNLSLYEVSSPFIKNLKMSELKIVPYMNVHSINGNAVINYKKDGGEIGTYSCTEHIYTLSTTDTLSQIKITSSDKDFIPVTRTVSLKSYPQISEPQIVTEDATCYYDTAVVTISDIEGGLDNGYKFMLEKDDKQIWTDKNPIKIPATIFGGNEQEVKLYVLDKDSISDDSGRLKRAFSKNIKLNYGETLDIKNWQVADLKCFEDNTGEISIFDWTPKNEDIKFEVWKSDKKVSDSQITENLAAGDYNLKIVDGNDCVNDSFQVTVNQPDKLQTSVKNFETPLCYGYADGKISTTTIGGTGDYTFLWNNGATTSDIENLNAGIYQLTVTDENKCQTSVSQVLTEPEELKNSLTPSFTICKNGELKIDEGELKTKEDLTYSWLLPNGNIHGDRVLVVTSDMPEGDYIMYTSDSKGCFTKDTTNIKFADKELKIKFLAPTYSYLGDTVVLAEDSEIFTDYTWSYQFNNDMFEDITSSIYDTPKNQTFLKTWTYGTDTITMYANDGHCNASFSKEVNVLNEQRSDYSNYETPSAGNFSRLAIGPSPNDGNFTLYANLTEEAALDVFILDLQTALKIPLKYDFKFVSDHYTIPVHGLNLLKGVYALFVTANGDTKYIKFTIK